MILMMIEELYDNFILLSKIESDLIKRIENAIHLTY